MKRLLAVLLVLLGLIGLALGRLGETTWAPATETTASVELSDPGPAVVIDPGVLYVGGMEGEVTIEGESDVSVITADNSDIEAYLEDTAYTRITGASDWSTLSTEAVHPDGETEISSPTDSDLWRTVDTSASPYTLEVADFAAQEHGENKQAYRSILVVTDGSAPGADSISITWPVEAENEWVPFAYAGGAAIAVIGLVLLVVSIGGRRRDEEELDEIGGEDVATDGVDETDAPFAGGATAPAAAGAGAMAAPEADDDVSADEASVTSAETTDVLPPVDESRTHAPTDDTEVLSAVGRAEERPTDHAGDRSTDHAEDRPTDRTETLAPVDDTEVLAPVDGDTDAWGFGRADDAPAHTLGGDNGTAESSDASDGPDGSDGSDASDGFGASDASEELPGSEDPR
ncbi:hypothetical protein [Brachybacterium alimentarium]|uniref:hypothetical protein n=1 Tax=Brachybacterium alimentarium TaxID=47845 RepID=UPI001FECF0B8|nr:hypothetical protein [Brachybacterium alimentarium]